jgi:hypothetical protein
MFIDGILADEEETPVDESSGAVVEGGVEFLMAKRTTEAYNKQLQTADWNAGSK